MLGLAAAGTALAAATDTGPSTTTDPYVLPVADGVKITSLLTVSDSGSASNGYEMVGLPDGLGAHDGPRGRDFTVLMNHELPRRPPGPGAVRRHGQNGAFASELEIDPQTLEVEDGQDLVDPGVRYWDYATHQYTGAPSPGQTAQFARWCSSFLSAPGQLFNKKTGRGYDGQIYFGNEENGDEGRAFGVTPTARRSNCRGWGCSRGRTRSSA